MNILFINIREDQPSHLNNDPGCSVSSQAQHSLLCRMSQGSTLDSGMELLREGWGLGLGSVYLERKVSVTA